MGAFKAQDERLARYEKILVAIVKHRLPTCKVYLFGSRARGTAGPGADIDLALDDGKKIPLNCLLDLYGQVEESVVPVPVDLIDVHNVSADMLKEIEREGIEWTVPKTSK